MIPAISQGADMTAEDIDKLEFMEAVQATIFRLRNDPTLGELTSAAYGFAIGYFEALQDAEQPRQSHDARANTSKKCK